MRLVAIKPNTYGTRRLQAGDEFDIGDQYARTLLFMGLARRAGGNQVDETVIKLRADAQALGIDVDKRWGARRLQAEIEARQKWGS
jgi:hypothetical protein